MSSGIQELYPGIQELYPGTLVLSPASSASPQTWVLTIGDIAFILGN